jgi:ribosome-associated protein
MINRNFEPEFSFQTSRSGGPGGQNVNKVNSKVELRFHIGSSNLLSDKEKILIHKNLKNRITIDGELIIVSQEERSQLRNKEIVIERFYTIIEKALKPKKKRVKTKPTLSSKLKRLKKKKIQSTKKQNRQIPNE